MEKNIRHNSQKEFVLFLNEIKMLIEESRNKMAVTVNSILTLLYWQIGNRINVEVLKGERAEYGKQILQILSAKLIDEYGKSFSKKNLHHMCRFAEVFPDMEIVSSLSRQLSSR